MAPKPKYDTGTLNFISGGEVESVMSLVRAALMPLRDVDHKLPFSIQGAFQLVSYSVKVRSWSMMKL